MFGTITKIHRLAKSANGNKFKRIEFKMNDGMWAKTDLVTEFRNYENWRKFLRVGITLNNLWLKDKETIDADSVPEIYIKPIGQMTDAEFFAKYS